MRWRLWEGLRLGTPIFLVFQFQFVQRGPCRRACVRLGGLARRAAGRELRRVGKGAIDHATIGVMMALYHRDQRGGKGQVIDVALHEAVFNVMESLIPEYDAFGAGHASTAGQSSGLCSSLTVPCSNSSRV